MMRLDDIPGYAQAVEREALIRNAAFLPVNESIGGFEVMPMTLRHLVALRVARSPLLGGTLPAPVDLAAFLWLLSPEFTLGESRARTRLLAQCRREFMPVCKPWLRTSLAMTIWERKEIDRIGHAAQLIDAARGYVEEAFQDAPPPAKPTPGQKSYYCDAISICALFGREFGWSEAQTMALPLKRLFQYLKVMQRDGNQPLYNPSDSVVAKWQAEQQQKAKSA